MSLFNGDQFAPYFIRPQTIEPNTIRSEVADTRRYGGDTAPLLRELKGRLHHLPLILNARREAGLYTDGRDRIEKSGRTFAMKQNCH